MNNKTTTSAARYTLSDMQEGTLWAIDQEPWRRCWFCDSRFGAVGDEYCGSCGARFTPRRYRGELLASMAVGMLLDIHRNPAITQDLLRLPVLYESFEIPEGTVALARTPEGTSVMPLSAHDALLMARALYTGVMQLYDAGYQLGKLQASDIFLQSDGSVALGAAPFLTMLTTDQHTIVRETADILATFVDIPRITRRFDIADADVNPLLTILADVRSDILTTLEACVHAVESAIAPFETRRSLDQVYAAKSDVGRRRAGNEDSILTTTTTWLRDGNNYQVGLYVVADGMGGHAAGEVASATAVQSIYEHIFAANMTHISNPQFASDVAGVVQCIDDAIQHANTQIMVEAKRLGNDMGTTMTMALVLGDVAYIANIGDSRTYICRDDQLRRVTNDHSLVMKLVELEHIAEDEIYTHPQRNGVLRSLGVSALAEVDIYIERLRPNDVLVLCSDGLWEMVRDPDIIGTMRNRIGLNNIADSLVDAANTAGGDDNISVILVKCDQ
ncbi:MAG: hypothetical protein RLY87_1140 [Chloroflexota bacterium]